MYAFEPRCAGPVEEYGLSSVMWLLVWAGIEVETGNSLKKILTLQRRQTCLRRSLGEDELPQVALKQNPKAECTMEC